MKAGIHLPNAQPYDLDTLLSVPWAAFFGLHLQIDLMRQIRQRQPDALIVLRYYHENAMSMAPSDVAGRIMTALWDEAHASGSAEPVTWHVCPANELNLSVEHGNDGGDWSNENAYRMINSWLFETAAELARIEPRLVLHFPAFSPGHSEDQPDRGFTGLDLCRQSVAAYDWFDDHAYWTKAADLLDPWIGARYVKKLRWLLENGFDGKPVLITETNRVVSWTDPGDQQRFVTELLRWWWALDAFPQIRGGCYFLWRGAGVNQMFTIADKLDVLDALRPSILTESVRQLPGDAPTTGSTEVKMNPYVEWIRAGGDGTLAGYIEHRGRLGDTPEKAMADVLQALLAPKG